eukprot:TRINITY_DN749_c0_g1_i1.p1 TRINITY_DN749_c0_g1~~TRINITY_DN749_c0_g1_i1.p1  ORF type:complete len:804 (+),score=196.57 TRINITY_DN749_c0_g1_i1:345-2414(+)
MLRKISSFLTLVAKVREHQSSQRGTASSLELPKEAKTLRDIELLLSDNDQGLSLKGIAVVDREAEWLRKSAETVRHRSSELLKHGLSTTSQAEIRTAIQAFYNMGQMSKVVQKVIADHSQELRKVITKELDPQNIQIALSESSSEEPKEQKLRTILFQKLEVTFQAMLQHLTKLSQLVKVMQKTRDPVTQVVFITAVQKEGSSIFVDEIWKPVTTMEDRMTRILKRFGGIVSEYPRILTEFNKFVQSAGEHFPSNLTVQQAASANPLSTKDFPSEPLRWKERCLEELQTRYLKESIAKLKEQAATVVGKINNCKPKDATVGGSPIASGGLRKDSIQIQSAQIDVRPFVAAVGTELAAAQSDTKLQQLICESIELAVQDILKHAKKEKITGRSAVVASSVATHNQLFNSVLVGTLLRLHKDLTTAMNRIPCTGEEDITHQGKLLQTLAGCEAEARSILSSLFSSIKIFLEAPMGELLTADRGEKSSKCLAVLDDRWAHLEANLLCLYSGIGCDTYDVMLRELTAGLIKMFLVLVSLVRPLSKDVVVGIAGDVTQFQLFSANICPSERIGKPYKELRAFRTLLSLSTEQLHKALTTAGRPDSVSLELAALSSITLLHALSQRLPSTPPVYDLLKLTSHQYAREITTNEAALQEVQQHAWAMYKEWGENLATDPEATMLWECIQAWHKRRMG